MESIKINRIINLCNKSIKLDKTTEIFDINKMIEIMNLKYNIISFEDLYDNNLDDIIRLQNDNYIRFNYPVNINIIPHGFTRDGLLMYIINTDESDYKIIYDYVKIEMYLCNIHKCRTYINDIIIDIELKDKDIKNAKQWLKENYNNRKRKRNEITQLKTNNSSTNILSDEWIAASKTRNYALNDPLLDYCEVYNVSDIKDEPRRVSVNMNYMNGRKVDKDINEANTFTDYLLKNGLKFEETIINELKRKFKNEMITIAESYEARSVEKYNNTLNAMKNGIPIIYQGVLHNTNNKTFGCADLVVRSDYLNKIVNTNVITERESKINAPYLGNNNYHYRIVDIKSAILEFNTDATTLRNNNNVKPFKCQIAIYNMALSEMQGYNPECGYILGKGWVMTKKGEKYKTTNPYDKLGKIDYNNRDIEYIDTAMEAIDWYRELKTTDEKMHHDPPTRIELYPNMCNQNDGKYHKVKQQIADKYADITLLWKCGPMNRENAFDNGIYRWDDPNCNSKVLGINGEYTSKRVDELLNFNKSGKIVSHEYLEFVELKDKEVLYVDFETLNEAVLYNTPNYNYNEIIFMIGVGKINNGQWEYKSYVINKISHDEERRILNEFIGSINNNNILVHWSSAEPNMFNKAKERHNIRVNVKWFDLLKYIEKNKVYVKGALKFGLKTFATKMYEYGLIQTKWNSDIMNGNDAMIEAWKLYMSNNVNNNSFNEIIKYNEIDVKVMYEIIYYFTRKN